MGKALLRLRAAAVVLGVFALSSATVAAELKQKTVAAFDQYVSLTQARFSSEFQPGGAFLYVDGMSSAEMQPAYEALKHGDILVQKLETKSQGKEIDVPNGMIHHWVALVFIPGVSLAQTLPVLQDYDHRAELYQPEVIASHVIAHQDNDYKIFLRLYQKRFTTVVFNSEYDIHWRKFNDHMMTSDSLSTRIAELKDANVPDGPELPVGNDRGYLWRLYTYWRFEEKDGGVYVQCEAVSLTRDIPLGLGWLLKPLVTAIPRNSLNRALGRTRDVVVQKAKPN